MTKKKPTGALAATVMGFAQVFQEQYETESVEVMPGAAPSNDDLEVTLDPDDPSRSTIRLRRDT